MERGRRREVEVDDGGQVGNEDATGFFIGLVWVTELGFRRMFSQTNANVADQPIPSSRPPHILLGLGWLFSFHNCFRLHANVPLGLAVIGAVRRRLSSFELKRCWPWPETISYLFFFARPRPSPRSSRTGAGLGSPAVRCCLVGCCV